MSKQIDPLAVYDYPDSQYRNAIVGLWKVVRFYNCGCRLGGHGTLQSPIQIVPCVKHHLDFCAEVKP